MLEFELSRTPEVIAGEIIDIVRDTQRAVISATIEIGKRLCEVKEMVPAGSWGQWLRENISYSERTAQNAMAIYNEYGRKGIPEGLMHASMTNALQLIGLPDDMKRGLIESGAAEDMSSRELKEEIARLKAERDEAQMRIEDLAGALQAEEDAASEAETQVKNLKHELEYMKDSRNAANKSKDALIEQAGRLREDIKQARSEAEELRRTALDASEKATREAERRRELELELELRKAQEAKTAPIQMEPAIIREDRPETLRELETLRDRLSRQKSETEIRFEEAYSDLVAQISYCVELAEQLGHEKGVGTGCQAARRLRTLMLNGANQLEERC